jgi:hypothetical protein
MYVLNGSLACLEGNGSTAAWTIPLTNLSNSSSWVHQNPTLKGSAPGVFASFGGSPLGDVAAFAPNGGLVFDSDTFAIFTCNWIGLR